MSTFQENTQTTTATLELYSREGLACLAKDGYVCYVYQHCPALLSQFIELLCRKTNPKLCLSAMPNVGYSETETFALFARATAGIIITARAIILLGSTQQKGKRGPL